MRIKPTIIICTTAGENEASFTQQLLDITGHMLKTGNSFSLKLSISNFSASSTKKEITSADDIKTALPLVQSAVNFTDWTISVQSDLSVHLHTSKSNHIADNAQIIK